MHKILKYIKQITTQKHDTPSKHLPVIAVGKLHRSPTGTSEPYHFLFIQVCGLVHCDTPLAFSLAHHPEVYCIFLTPQLPVVSVDGQSRILM